MIPEFLIPLYPKNPYHNFEHTNSFDWASCPSEEAKWAAIFHDFVYEPRRAFEHVRRSADAFVSYAESISMPSSKQARIVDLIVSTSDHVLLYDSNDKDMEWLHQNDLRCFIDPSTSFDMEQRLFREHQWVSYPYYLTERLPILRKYKRHPLVDPKVIDDKITFLKIWKPSHGLYVGSFNPFHRGHLDIVHQASRIFDKIIIAQGWNEDKETHTYPLMDNDAVELVNYEKRTYGGPLFDYLEKQKKVLTNLSVIRGLRNGNDLHDESGIFNFSRDHTDVPFVYFLSQVENSHLSSGSLRKLSACGYDISKYALV